MVSWDTFGVLGRKSNSQKTYGMLTILRSNRIASPPSPQYRRSDLSPTTSRLDIILDRPHCSTRDRITETINRSRTTLLESLHSSTRSSETLRTSSQAND